VPSDAALVKNQGSQAELASHFYNTFLSLLINGSLLAFDLCKQLDTGCAQKLNNYERLLLSSIMRENGKFSSKTLENTGTGLTVYLQIRKN